VRLLVRLLLRLPLDVLDVLDLAEKPDFAEFRDFGEDGDLGDDFGELAGLKSNVELLAFEKNEEPRSNLLFAFCFRL
jgi:hypothetical protein